MTCRAWDTLGTQDLCLSFTRLSEYSAERGGHRQRSSAARRMGTQQYQSIAYFELGQGAAAAKLGHGPVSTYGYGGFPGAIIFFPPHAARVLCMRPQKTSDDPTFAACQIEALDPLINMAYKDFFNGSVLGQNLVVFLAFYS